jgi:hypothetical protein
MNNDKIYSFVRDLVSLKKTGVDENRVAVSLWFYIKFVRDLVSLKDTGVNVNRVAVSLWFYTKFEQRAKWPELQCMTVDMP